MQLVIDFFLNSNYPSLDDVTCEIDRVYTTPQRYMVRTSTAREASTPRGDRLNRSKQSEASSNGSYDAVKQDVNRLFEQNRRNHQQAIIANNKLIQGKLRLQTAINKTEAKFIEKSLIMDSVSIKGMNSKELGQYCWNSHLAIFFNYKYFLGL